MSRRTNKYADDEKYKAYLRRGHARYRERTGSNRYEPRHWTTAEIEKVMAHDKPDRELSVEIGRSVSAIQHMRSRCKGGK